MTTATLRPATAGDRELLLAFMAEYYRFDGLPFDRARAAAALDGLLADPRLGRVWVVEVESQDAGYVVLTFGYSLEYHGRDAFVDEIYLAAAHRGRGVGRRALDRVAAEARRLGVEALHLEVERENRAAQSLYRKAGFVDHDRYLMTRRLGAPADAPGD